MKEDVYTFVRSFISGKSKEKITELLIQESIETLLPLLKDMNDGNDLTLEDKEDLLWNIERFFTVQLSNSGTIIGDDTVERWFDEHKTEFDYHYWNAYKRFLAETASSIPESVIEANEKIIDGVLDYSGDPRKDGNWHRKGMVMGNVQSGKTLNYIGLINKAADIGYKVFILIGGHQNDLRKQTQQRVDEGFIGKTSKHLADAFKISKPYGVGKYRNYVDVDFLTSTLSDFSSSVANATGKSLRGNTPTIFVVKKNTVILENLLKWIKQHHNLDPENNIRLNSQLMFIDDEADYATPNSKKMRDEISKTPEIIRKLLNLFERSTYVGYSATPFANIFMDPYVEDKWEGDNLFPSDFMVRVPTPENYVGQNYYFDAEHYGKGDPVVIIEKAVRTFSNLKNYMDSEVMKSLKKVFEKRFDVPETFEDIRKHFEKATSKIKVIGVNAESGNNLDYSLYKENGLSAIVIGGHKLSRGLTLEGLSVTYFSRNSKNYDTLMQMCRWFGYRDGWKDVCKVYMPIESYDHYSFVSEAISDLYAELERMKELGRTPSEFGLKVKEHPGSLLITAKNRMENVVSETVKIGFEGQRVRRFRFKNDEKVNKRNLEITERFLSEIKKSSNHKKVRESIIFEDIEHNQIIDFIKGTDLPEDMIGNKALINHIKTMKDFNFKNFKVALYNQSSTRVPNWMKKDEFQEEASKAIKEYSFLGEQIQTPMRSIFSNGKEIFGRKAELGNSGLDEGLFLSEESYSLLKKNGEKAPRVYISGNILDENGNEKIRDFPALIIYLFSISYRSGEGYCVPFNFPCVGLSLSFPIIEAQKGLGADELKKYFKESKESVSLNAVAQYHQLDLWDENEEDYYG